MDKVVVLKKTARQKHSNDDDNAGIKCQKISVNLTMYKQNNYEKI